MDIQAFLPARYAEQTSEGMSILGGGLATVMVKTVPHEFKNLAVAVKLLFDKDDARSEHTLQVRLTDHQNEVMFETEVFPTPIDAIPPGLDLLNVNLAVSLSNILFVHEGLYWFDLIIDGNVAKKAPLRLIVDDLVEQPS